MKLMDLATLKDKFPEEDVLWRVGRCGVKGDFKTGKVWVEALAYIDNRAIMDRLDDACGAENWQNEIRIEGDFVLCGIGICIEPALGTSRWIWKWDGAQKTDIEPIKGGISGAMKRAGYQWGIGRYLYNLKGSWGKVCESGSHFGRATNPKDKSQFRTFCWNPPKLPAWALPGTTKVETTTTGKGETKKDKTQKEAPSTVKTKKETPSAEGPIQLRKLLDKLKACKSSEEVDAFLKTNKEKIAGLDSMSKDNFFTAGKRKRVLVINQGKAQKAKDAEVEIGAGMEALVEMEDGAVCYDELDGFGEDFNTSPPKRPDGLPEEIDRAYMDKTFSELVALIKHQTTKERVLKLLDANRYIVWKMGMRGGEIIDIARKWVKTITNN